MDNCWNLYKGNSVRLEVHIHYSWNYVRSKLMSVDKYMF